MNFKRLFFLISIAGSILSCGKLETEGEALAIRNCSFCHSYPVPSLLDKKTWANGVFPEMAFRMSLDISKVPNTQDERELNEILKTLPGNPLVTEDEWKLIKEYYINEAPDSLTLSAGQKKLPLQQFSPSVFRLPVKNNTMLTMVRCDSVGKQLFLATRQNNLYRLNFSLEVVDSVRLKSPASHMLINEDGNCILSCMGIMDPNDQPVGTVIEYKPGVYPIAIIDSLKRPVDVQRADLNNDGQQDLVVSAFGNFTGALLAYEQTKGKYLQHVIHNFPGTRKTVITDFNNDGLPDILALITQGDEQLALFTNRGNFGFSFQILLKFPPVYGSSYFALVDFDKDGNIDILYTNGDNADYSSVLKPYHGVRVFLNNGNNQFKQSWFYPMPGASMAQALDFDEDGDIDIAAISFFPDFTKSPENGFIYFENERGDFTPYVTKLAASSRWITMETGDIDNDLDVDVILAGLTFPDGVPDSLFQVWKKDPTSLLVLKNNLR